MIARFQIVPRARKYVIEAVDDAGARKVIETFPTEDAAVRRLRVLQGPDVPLARQEDRRPPKKEPS